MFHKKLRSGNGSGRALVFSFGSALCLTACASADVTRSGFLSDYSRLEPRTDTVRAKVAQYSNAPLLQSIERIWIEPTVLAGDIGDGFSEEEKAIIVREIDRRLCFAVSDRFQIVDQQDSNAGRLRAAASRIAPTNAVGSSASAVANFFIPGPLGVRVPGSTGGLAAEAELLDANGQQAAAVVWARDAQVVGTESPSLSRIGDAHQLTGAFADIVADAVEPEGRAKIDNAAGDPCARFGPRIRPEGFVSRVVTGLYTPSLSGAQPADTDKEKGEDAPTPSPSTEVPRP